MRGAARRRCRCAPGAGFRIAAPRIGPTYRCLSEGAAADPRWPKASPGRPMPWCWPSTRHCQRHVCDSCMRVACVFSGQPKPPHDARLLACKNRGARPHRRRCSFAAPFSAFTFWNAPVGAKYTFTLMLKLMLAATPPHYRCAMCWLRLRLYGVVPHHHAPWHKY